MGTVTIIGTCAVTFAAASGTILGRWAAMRAHRMHMRRAAGLKLDPSDRFAIRAKSLGHPCKPLARALLQIPKMQQLSKGISPFLEAEWKLGTEAFLSALISFSLITGIAACALTASPAFALAAMGICMVGTWLYIRHRVEEDQQRMRSNIPNALRSLTDSFRSGHSLVQTMQQASVDAPGRLGEMFGTVAHSLELGRTTSESLAGLQGEGSAPELAFVAVALDVQHQSGGSIAPVMESAREVVEGELELLQTLHVQTAQAKLSASIVTIMPFVLIAFFSLASPGFLSPFLESPLGICLLAIALCMQGAGVLAVRRICKVDR